MTFEIEVGGRLRTVSVESIGAASGSEGCFRVTIDGVAREVESRSTELGLSIRYIESARTVDAAVTDLGKGDLWIQLPRAAVEASVDARRYRRSGGGQAAGTGEMRIAAPMPGRVVRVLVEAGQEVTAGQGLIVVEAMKMENEIASPRAGRVKEVGVTPGQPVESGRLLITVE
jgi:biotin carboxyl carrier protein